MKTRWPILWSLVVVGAGLGLATPSRAGTHAATSNLTTVDTRQTATSDSEVAPPPDGMALVPASSFQMGDAFGEGDFDERPVHTVFVSAFYLDRTEVTKARWDEVYAWAIQHGYGFSIIGVTGRPPTIRSRR